MKRKNILTIVLAVALMAVLAVGTTLAFFTDNDKATNTFTMGNVAIDLKESDDAQAEDSEYVDDGITFENVMPGDTETKIAKIFVAEGSADCFVRVTAKITAPAETALTAADIGYLTDAVVDAIGTTDWAVTVEEDGTIECIYKATAIAEDTLVLFESIQIPGAALGNNAMNQEFGIELNAYAVQAANIGNDPTTVAWDSLSFD